MKTSFNPPPLVLTAPRIVGNREWREFAASPEEALARGVRLDAMTRLPGMPDFQPRGVFRGSHAFFA